MVSIPRRSFLRGTVLLTGSAFAFVQEMRGHSLAALSIHPQGGADPIRFESLQVLTLAAVASRIIPTTDQPGAAEVGVVIFINSRVGRDPELLALYRDGLDALDRTALEVHQEPFHRLGGQTQDELLRRPEGEGGEAGGEDHPSPGGDGGFLARARRDTVDAFYTSPLGVFVASGRRVTKTHAFCTANEGVPDVDQKPEF